MIELKRISYKELEETVWKAHTKNIPLGKAFTQAQLDADKEKVKKIVQEITGDVDKMISQFISQRFIEPLYHDFIKGRLQTFTQKWLG